MHHRREVWNAWNPSRVVVIQIRVAGLLIERLLELVLRRLLVEGVGDFAFEHFIGVFGAGQDSDVRIVAKWSLGKALHHLFERGSRPTVDHCKTLTNSIVFVLEEANLQQIVYIYRFASHKYFIVSIPLKNLLNYYFFLKIGKKRE